MKTKSTREIVQRKYDRKWNVWELILLPGYYVPIWVCIGVLSKEPK